MVKVSGSKVFSQIGVGSAVDDSMFIDAASDNLKFQDANSIIKEVSSPMDSGIAFKVEGINTINQSIDRAITFSNGNDFYVEAYTDTDGRFGTVDTINTNADFDTDKYKAIDLTMPYVIIEATAVSESVFNINNCTAVEFDIGKWVVYCSTGTYDVRHAQIIKTLFYGTNGTNPAVLKCPDITAMKTSVTDDVGRRCHLAYLYGKESIGYSEPVFRYTGTFENTSDNLVDSWSYLNGYTDSYNPYVQWEMPSSTNLNYTGQPVSDETGIDTSSDQITNPATCELELRPSRTDSNYGVRYAYAIILTKGAISWVFSNPDGSPSSDYSYYTNSYYATYGIPDFTAATENPSTIITHDIPANRVPSGIGASLLAYKVEDWEEGISVDYRILSTTNSTLTTEIENYSFENALGDEWDVSISGSWSSYTRSSDAAEDGTWSFKTAESSQSNNEGAYVHADQIVDTRGWNKIHVSNWLNTTNGSVQLNIYIDDDVVYTRTKTAGSGATQNDSSWTTGSGDVTASSRKSSATLRIEIIGWEYYSGGRTSTCWVDNIYVDKYIDQEDTGWLNANDGTTMSSFSTFEYSPTQLLVRLNPKDSSPTTGYPSINGICMVCE